MSNYLFSAMLRSLLVAVVLALNCSGYAVAQENTGRKSVGEGGVIRLLSYLTCGQNGVRTSDRAKAIQVIVVGNSGSLNCIISINEAMIKKSDFRAGYACVGRWKSKPASFVRKNDPRVVREPKYANSLRKAEEAAAAWGLRLEVVYILTSSGPPHVERRCG